jgi:hypothetical protein
MNDLDHAARPGPGTSRAARLTRLPVTVTFSQFAHSERTAPGGTSAPVRFRLPEKLLPGDVTSGQRDRWAVVTHVARSGPEVTIQVQEAGGSRTMTCGAQGPGFGVRSDLRVDPSTCPDIPDGFPPRWGVWRDGPGISTGTLAWYPERGEAAVHARQASRDGSEYVVELEAPDGCWTQVDAYRQGKRSAWGTRLAAGQGMTTAPPWATSGKDGSADQVAGWLASLASRDEADRVKAQADRAPAVVLARSSFPAHAQAGPSAAPPGPAPRRARPSPSDRTNGRRR